MHTRKNTGNIELRVTNDRCVISIPSLNDGIDTVCEGQLPAHKYTARFMVDIYESKTAENIGFLKGISFEPEKFFGSKKRKDLTTSCGIIPADLSALTKIAANGSSDLINSIFSPGSHIMYIQNIYIEKKYRGLGIGTYLLDNIGSIFQYSFGYTNAACILNPYPQIKYADHEAYASIYASPEEELRLINFFVEAGYKPIPDSNLMLVNIDKK